MSWFSRGVRGGTAIPLTARFYLYEFLDEFVLLYPVYALLFVDTGVSTSQLTYLFIIWSLTGVLCEVPSGVLADIISRRVLLAVGPVLRAAGFALWVVAPSYWAFALGFVLWGLCGALQSGAKESLLYDELARRGRADRYAAVLGRSRAFATVAVFAAMLIAAPVFGSGGYRAVGAASVAACLACAAIAWTLTDHRVGRSHEHPGVAAYGQVLRDGLRQVGTRPAVLRLVLLVSVVTAIWGSLEEFVPLLAERVAVAGATVPLLVLVVTAGITLGGLLAGPARRLGPRPLGAVVAVAALATVVGALSGQLWGFVPVALAFGVFNLAGILSEARLQEEIPSAVRATVTSVAGLGVETAGIAIYLLYALSAHAGGHGFAFALLGGGYLLIAVLIARQPRRAPAAEPVRAGSAP